MPKSDLQLISTLRITKYSSDTTSGGSDRFDWARRPNGSVVLGLESLCILVRTGTSAGVLQIGACRGPSGTGDGTAVAWFWRRGCVAYVATVRVAWLAVWYGTDALTVTGIVWYCVAVSFAGSVVITCVCTVMMSTGIIRPVTTVQIWISMIRWMWTWMIIIRTTRVVTTKISWFYITNCIIAPIVTARATASMVIVLVWMSIIATKGFTMYTFTPMIVTSALAPVTGWWIMWIA